MKMFFRTIVLTAFSVIILPLIPVILSEDNFTVAESNGESCYTGEPYKVLDVSTGEVIEVDEKTYVIGAVCAEMPATFSDEALKAQAVCAHTYAERQRLRERSAPTEELCGADFSNDTSKYQGYFTKNQAMEFYGENFDSYYKKISSLVDEVIPYVITYGDEPIIAAFHSMSSGKTESAENAWGVSVDYLVPVDSMCDKSAPRYTDTVEYEKETLRQLLVEKFTGIILDDDFTSWIVINEVSDSGTVLSAMVGDMKVNGNDIRLALGLRSACFDISYSDSTLTVTTRGFGHGVGMSQYGADSMADDGKTWREILMHYYPDCSIEKQ